MTLLEVSGMDLHFNTKDVIYIVGLVVGGLSAWFKVKLDKSKMQGELDTLNNQVEKEIDSLNTQIDKEIDTITNIVDKNETTMFKKLTNIHTRMDKNEEQNKGELNNIKSEISEVKSGISAINGKLDILISK